METCRRGHPWTEENTYSYTITKPDGSTRQQRTCRICRNERNRGELGAYDFGPGPTHCVHGHEWTQANTVWIERTHKTGNISWYRVCRECIRARQAARRQADKEAKWKNPS